MTVYLVGAGPGDPDLITRKGLRLIQQADVIIYDRLIPIQLLNEARPDAQKIDAGKAPAKHRLSQDEINQTIIHHARDGKTVVRLKGGDPFVFGRGGEEALACYAAGIPFEVVPGITSAIAVPAYAGIPVTHRQVSKGFVVITGHEPTLNYHALIQTQCTLVILMGVKQLKTILSELCRAGLSNQTPAAIIQQGTMPEQHVTVGTIESLSYITQDIQPPAITIIGDVVKLREQGVNWQQKEK
ncbi:MAG: uroporphyrinogen-III C-methyltransferase [Phototrophicales bacterium]|nr:MAG: uroporphyrinogen-III C-methyltransferase [Phototrophicales bacterium]